MVSIIIGYRNRETPRIQRCLESLSLQSSKDFELIFVDYGSDDAMAAAASILVRSFSFAQYIFNDTRGMYWNRSHALNSGIHYASGEIILFADIDLVFEPDFISKLSALNFQQVFYTFNCYYLPEGYEISGKTKQEMAARAVENYVGLFAIAKDYIAAINGFDEYYMVWGIEDFDIYDRLEKAGYNRVGLTAAAFASYHQWHASHYMRQPSPWYISMLKHQFSADAVTGNDTGSIYTDATRPCAGLYDTRSWSASVALTLYDNEEYLYHPFYAGFHALLPGSTAYYAYDAKPSKAGRLQPFVSLLNKASAKIPGIKYRIVSVDQKEHPTRIKKKLSEFITDFIGCNRGLLDDYFISETGERILLILKKKGSANR